MIERERAAQPDDRAAGAEEPALGPEELALDADGRAAGAEEPARAPEKLALDADDRAAEAEEPALDPDELAVDAYELALDPDELALAAEGLALDRDELGLAAEGLVPDPDELAAEDGTTGEPSAARRAFQMIRTGVATAREPIVDRVGQAMAGAERTWSERPGARVRRVRRMGKVPLPYLYDVHPEARSARPVDVGLVTIDDAAIVGTAVGGGAQRGGDFLPLRPFRGDNWRARWQRLRRAQDQLVALPPIDVVKYADGYWVVDGHNRVGLALYGGQVAIDANVVELVPPGERRTEPILPLAATVAASQAVRTAGGGQRPSHLLVQEDSVPIDPPDVAE